MMTCREVLRSVGRWFSIEDKEKWLKDMRGMLSLVASIIATLTFQSAINPPGGVFQVNLAEKLNGTLNNSTGEGLILRPGEAVLATVYPDDYLNFLVCNTICFIASLSVCLLLVSGFPLNHRFTIWILSIGMFITSTSLALTYLFAASMVTPEPIWGSAASVFGIVLLVWIALSGIVGFVLIMGLIVWIFRKSREICCCH